MVTRTPRKIGVGTGTPREIGLRTYRLNPATTRRSVSAPGTGVPLARTNWANVHTTGTRPATMSATPRTWAARPVPDWYPTFQPVILHGSQTAPAPAVIPNHTTLT